MCAIDLWPAPGRAFKGNWDQYRLLKESAINRKIYLWNDWRMKNPKAKPKLMGADLRGLELDEANLKDGDFRDANLCRASLQEMFLENIDFRNAKLTMVNFSGVKATNCNFRYCDLSASYLMDSKLTDCRFDGCNLSGANLTDAVLKNSNLKRIDLSSAILIRTDLSEADLRSADFDDAILHGTIFEGANLNQASVLRSSVRYVKINKTTSQKNLQLDTRIWKSSPGFISFRTNRAQDIRVAYFFQMMHERDAIRNLIQAGTLSAVLLLGRFSPQRKKVLDGIGVGLRRFGYVPIIFDFPRPSQRDLMETVKFLATICSFIVVDLTAPKSSPLELQLIVPELMMPIVPIIQEKSSPFSMFWDLKNKYSWLLAPISYMGIGDLQANLEKGIIKRANLMRKNITKIRTLEAEDIKPISSIK